MKKIISYNLNGIRAAMKKGLKEWIKDSGADIVCVQETKAQPEQIHTEEFEEIGYNCYWFSAQKKGYSGVGILSKVKPDNIIYGMGIKKYDDEGRVIIAHFGDVTILNVYHPSGTMGETRQSFKMIWLDDFLNYVSKFKNTHPKLIITGDFNIAHTEIDIHDPKGNQKTSGFLPEEREWLTKFLNSGFTDSFRHFNKEPHNYTWWSVRHIGARDRNLGWRIDYEMINNPFINKIKSAAIYPQAKHSDHCPISITADF